MAQQADGGRGDRRGGGPVGGPVGGPNSGMRVLLASRSPRRRDLLERAGLLEDIVVTSVDDGLLNPGAADPSAWVMSLAFLKASAGVQAEHTRHRERCAILGADTICVVDGRVVGQPADRAEAARILRSMLGREHEVLTGVALLCPRTLERDLFCDRSSVRMGELSERDLGAYLDSDEWGGKAGGYNLADRIDAGWPIEFDGEASSIMGLPMGLLTQRLAAFARRVAAA
ncbi:MAG: Maf family protein [Planctomycetota bacterium]